MHTRRMATRTVQAAFELRRSLLPSSSKLATWSGAFAAPSRLRLWSARAPWFLVAALTGCTPSSATTEAAWPEKPAPAYPDTPPPTDAPPAPAPAAPTSAITTPKAPSVSPLRADFASRRALESFRGKATYYADSLAGNKTASGEVYEPSAFTAAHKKLPFGTILRVTRVDGGQSTYVKVNDRGPFGPADRVLDLSRGAAEELEMMRAGVVAVRVEVLEKPKKK